MFIIIIIGLANNTLLDLWTENVGPLDSQLGFEPVFQREIMMISVPILVNLINKVFLLIIISKNLTFIIIPMSYMILVT